MSDVSSVRVSGPLASLADDFREGLEGRGYSLWTVVGYLRLMGHLSRWLADSGLDRPLSLPAPGRPSCLPTRSVASATTDCVAL